MLKVECKSPLARVFLLIDGFEGVAIAVFFSKRQAGTGGRHAAGAGRMRERRGGHAHSRLQAAWQFPAFVQAEQHSGAKGIAGAGRSGNKLVRQPQRGLPHVFAFASARETALGEMDYYQFANALLKE